MLMLGNGESDVNNDHDQPGIDLSIRPRAH